MMLSIFLAKIIGIYFIIVALSMLTQNKYYSKIVHDFYSKPGLLCLAGVMKLIIGLLIVLNHNIWMESWVTIITVLGWLSVVGALFIFFMPKYSIKTSKKLLEKNGFVWIHSIALLLGIYLVYIAYFYVV